MKVVRNFIVGILLTVYFIFVIFNTIILLNINNYGVTQFDDVTLVSIRNEITSDKYKKGDIVLVRYKDITKIVPGDEIFVYKVQKSGRPLIDFGTVGEIHVEESAISFENGATYSMDLSIGSAYKVFPDLGSVYNIVQSSWGFFFLILLPSFLIFIYELYAIIVEIKQIKA